MHQRWADCKFFQSESSSDLIKFNPIQSWSARFLKIISQIQSWSANAKSCRPILFCLMKQKNYWSYFSFSQIRLVEGKIVPAVVFCLMRQNRHSLLAFPKFNKDVSTWHLREKHCWSYFSIRGIRLLGLVKWQGRYTWISVRFLLHDL